MVGKTVGHFRIEELLGRGAMGEVYRARDDRLHRSVAIKFLGKETSTSSEVAEQLLHEARAAARLTHRYICAVYDVGEHEGRPFLVMELVKGRTLREVLDGEGLDDARVVELAGYVAEGLSAAHDQGVVHRDIKPDNIMLTPDGRVKIMDFGVAAATEGTLRQDPEQISGTLSYMAPEQLGGGEIDQRCDTWSLAVTVYEMVSGRLPFQGTYPAEVIYQILNVEPADLATLRRDCPASVAAAVGLALSKDPGERPVDVATFAALLRGEAAATVATATTLTTTSPVPPSPVVPPSPDPDPLWRRRSTLLLAILVAAIAAAVFLWRSLSGDVDTPPPTLAVADFRELGGETGSLLGAGMTELLSIGLLESSPVRVVSREYLLDQRRRLVGPTTAPLAEKDALAVSRQAGVTYLLTGQFSLIDGGDMVTWRLIDVTSGDNLVGGRERVGKWTRTADLIIAEVIPAVAGISGTAVPVEFALLARLTSDSDEALKHYTAGRLALDNVKYDLARTELDRAVAADSTFALAHFALGRLYSNIHGGIGDADREMSHVGAAWRHRQRLSLRDRLRVEAWRARQRADLQESRTLFDEMMAHWSDDLELLLDQLRFLYNRSHFREGIAVADLALTWYDEDVEIISLRSVMAAALGDFATGVRYARRRTRLASDDVEAWSDLAGRWLNAAKVDSAEQAVARALELDPTYLPAHILRCGGLYARGDLPTATVAMGELVEDEVYASQRTRLLTSSAYSVSLCMLLAEAGRFDASEAAFQRALGSTPGVPFERRAHRMPLRYGSWRESLDWANTVLAGRATAGDSLNALSNRAWALALADSTDAAARDVAELSRLADKFGNIATLLSRLAEMQLWLGRGEPDSTLALVRKIRQAGLHPGGMWDLELRDAEISALRQAGRLAEAERAVREELRIYGGHAVAYFTLGEVLAEDDRGQEAAQAYRQFLTAWSDADPGHRWLTEARDRLEALDN